MRKCNSLLALSGHGGEIDSTVFSPDGKLLASGGKEKTIKFWDPQSSKRLQPWTAAQSLLEALAFSRAGSTLASGSGGPETLVRIDGLNGK